MFYLNDERIVIITQVNENFLLQNCVTLLLLVYQKVLLSYLLNCPNEIREFYGKGMTYSRLSRMTLGHWIFRYYK